MADMTDAPFCTIVRRVSDPPHPNPLPIGEREQFRSPIMFREMVASDAIVRENPKTLEMVKFEPIERPIIQQIFGSEPEVMGRAAAIIMERFAPDGIDINMGCPVYKLTSNFNGAALMKEPERAADIVRTIKSAIGDSAPVSVKIRLGWSDLTQGREFAKVLEDAGADLITVHGRTKCQAYTGRADWNEIGEIKKGVSIPVLANGDIVDAITAQQALSLSRCDGVMIARGALGNPWVFREILKALSFPSDIGDPETIVDSGSRAGMTVSLSEKISIILQHAELMIERYGPHGMIQFRKHLSWYFKGIAGTKALRMELMEINTLDELKTILIQSPVVSDQSG